MPRKSTNKSTTKKPRTKLHPPRVKKESTPKKERTSTTEDRRPPLKFKKDETNKTLYYNDTISYQVWVISRGKRGKYLVTGYSYTRSCPTKYLDSGTRFIHECGVELLDHPTWNVTWPGTLEEIMEFPLIQRSTLTEEAIESATI